MSSKKVILAVDDVSMNLAVLKGILSPQFDVRVAKSAELALYILGSAKVDLILLDIEMPGMSGFEFLDVIKELPAVSEIPFIFVTSHASPQFVAKAIRAGAADYLAKPVNKQSLMEKVYRALELPIEE